MYYVDCYTHKIIEEEEVKQIFLSEIESFKFEIALCEYLDCNFSSAEIFHFTEEKKSQVLEEIEQELINDEFTEWLEDRYITTEEYNKNLEEED